MNIRRQFPESGQHDSHQRSARKNGRGRSAGRRAGIHVELQDATQIHVGRTHCRYCARAEAISKLKLRCGGVMSKRRVRRLPFNERQQLARRRAEAIQGRLCSNCGSITGRNGCTKCGGESRDTTALRGAFRLTK